MAPRVSPVVRMVNRTAAQNFERYVDAGRHSSAFGPISFDNDMWVIDVGTATRPNGSLRGSLAFTRGSTARNASYRDASPFAEPFGCFIKAFVRLEEQSRHKDVTGHRTTIAVARLLHRVSGEIGHDPRAMSGATFSKAESLLKDEQNQGEYSPTTSYRMGVVLERIARTLTEAGIAARRIDFRNSIARPTEARRLDGKDGRMPTDEVLRALFSVSTSDLTDCDRLRIRLVEFLWSGPWRINEVIRLPVDCEVHRAKTANGVPVLDAAGAPVMEYGIRHSGSKGFLGSVKWIPTTMVSVTQRALREIREITAASREVCRWMEANPGRAWLPEPLCGAALDDLVSSVKAAEALGLASSTGFNSYASYHGIVPVECHSGRRRAFGYRQGDIEDVLLRRTKPIAGRDGLKRSEYLFVLPRGFFDSAHPTIPSIIDIITHQNVSDFLGGRQIVQSIFERLDLRDSDGRPCRLTSHQIRHLLNTIAAENGLGEYERAHWSGRSDIRHNDAYDHESGYQLAERARKMLENDRMRGPIAVTFQRLPPVERSAFSLVQLATVHTTDIGLCFHDWGAAPCPYHGACASCRDCAIVKGDPVHRARVEILLQEEQITLGRALVEVDDGTYGASNFVEHGRRMVAGYRRMLAIHDDPAIEDGTMVQLQPEPMQEGLLHLSEPTA